MREFMEFLGGVLIALVVMFALGGGAIRYIENRSCNAYEDVTGRETKFVFLVDCYVKDGEGWLTKKEYQSVIVAREGLKK